MTFEGENVGELLDFIDEKFGDKGCLLLDYKKIGVWNYEKMFLRTNAQTSCTIVFYRSDEGKCDVYLWGTGGGIGVLTGVDWGSQKSIRDAVAEQISTYAVEQLKLRKTYDAAEVFLARTLSSFSFPFLCSCVCDCLSRGATWHQAE